ncbi:MAG: lasso peptide biosynthesis PqqD family chaperone [Bacteroidota bacterium]
MITEDSYIKRNKEVFASEIDEEVVMMNVDTGKYYGMDTVGSRIWELIAEEIQVKDVIGKLMEEYDVEEEQCKNDVLEFLNELYENKLVQVTK